MCRCTRNGSSSLGYKIKRQINVIDILLLYTGFIIFLKFNSALIPLNSQIKLNIIELDQYNRVLAEIITLNGLNVSKQMLSEGLLVRYPYQRNCQAYDSYQASAKLYKLGVWSDPTFVLPYEWRRTTLSPSIGIGK